MDEENRRKLRSTVTVNILNKKKSNVIKIPNIEEFQASKLPLLKEVIGVVLGKKDSKTRQSVTIALKKHIT